MHPAKKSPLVHREHPDLLQGPHRGRADFVLQKSHFSKDILLPQHGQAYFLTILFLKYFDLSRLNDVHAIPFLSLVDNDLSFSVNLAQSPGPYDLPLFTLVPVRKAAPHHVAQISPFGFGPHQFPIQGSDALGQPSQCLGYSSQSEPF